MCVCAATNYKAKQMLLLWISLVAIRNLYMNNSLKKHKKSGVPDYSRQQAPLCFVDLAPQGEVAQNHQSLLQIRKTNNLDGS